MMPQGILPFKYEMDLGESGLTGLGGLLTYLDFAQVMGLSRAVEEHVGVRTKGQGWTDSEMVMSLVLLNLAGGECVEDLKKIESDEGFCKVLRRSQMHGMSRQQRRAMERRWRKEKRRSVPSASSVFRYLGAFHDEGQEGNRELGKAFIPMPNAPLRGLVRTNAAFLRRMQKADSEERATLDMDATLVETEKGEAFFCYEGYKAYQPLNTWWAERGMVLHTEFRDGNVPAGYEQLRVLKEALECLPEGVKKVRMRSDTAGYQHDLLRYCEGGENERFGRIEFAVGCDVTKEFKKAVMEVEERQWHPVLKKVGGGWVESGRQWAEVCFVPNAIGHSKKGCEYRYIAIRERMQEQLLLVDEGEREYPFPTMMIEKAKYKVFGIVTNMDWDGQELLRWFYERCGKSEEVHSVMKEDLSGGKLPSGEFGANAAWWWIMVLALNLNAAMKRLILGKDWVSKRMKAIRFSLINLPARVLERSRQVYVRLSKGHPSFQWLLQIRARIAALAFESSG